MTTTDIDVTPILTVSRYLCGACGDESVGPWWEHQAHYENHQGNKQ